MLLLVKVVGKYRSITFKNSLKGLAGDEFNEEK